MNTGKWGPYGWTLTHSVAANYPMKPTPLDKKTYKDFYMNLRFILPCIYCRQSFTEYLKKRPLTDVEMSNKQTLSKHHYDVHNLVNDKLRNQGHISYNDPAFGRIYKRYRTMKTSYSLPRIWNFIWAVTLNYTDSIEPVKKRHLKVYYRLFFEHLAYLFPGTQKQKRAFNCCWNRMKPHFNEYTKDCQSMAKFVYTLQMCMYSHLRMHISSSNRFYSLQKTYKFFEKWRAGCSKKTCRSPINKNTGHGYAKPFQGYTYKDFTGPQEEHTTVKCMRCYN